jgi:hypothetical protein
MAYLFRGMNAGRYAVHTLWRQMVNYRRCYVPDRLIFGDTLVLSKLDWLARSVPDAST